jgi:hypothetical protein
MKGFLTNPCENVISCSCFHLRSREGFSGSDDLHDDVLYDGEGRREANAGLGVKHRREGARREADEVDVVGREQDEEGDRRSDDDEQEEEARSMATKVDLVAQRAKGGGGSYNGQGEGGRKVELTHSQSALTTEISVRLRSSPEILSNVWVQAEIIANGFASREFKIEAGVQPKMRRAPLVLLTETMTLQATLFSSSSTLLNLLWSCSSHNAAAPAPTRVSAASNALLLGSCWSVDATLAVD